MQSDGHRWRSSGLGGFAGIGVALGGLMLYSQVRAILWASEQVRAGKGMPEAVFIGYTNRFIIIYLVAAFTVGFVFQYVRLSIRANS
jgi:hypothetical protein